MATKFDTLVDVFTQSTEAHGARDFIGEKRDGAWRWLSYAGFKEKVDQLRAALALLGVKPQDRVAVIANNRAEWAIGAYATYTLGGAYVPMYEAQHDKDWAYILRDCGASVLLCASDKIAQRVKGLRQECPALEHIVSMEEKGEGEAGDGSFASLLRRGALSPSPVHTASKSDLAGLIYTSGTTANPKGVRLSHGNIASNVSSMHELLQLTQDDRSLSFLPWAHSFGQVVELHGLFSMGASLGIAESVEKLLANMAEIKPTVIFAVPRIFNKLYAGLNRKMSTMKPMRRGLLELAMKGAAQRRSLREQGRHAPMLEVRHALLDKLVLSKVREGFFGGRLRFAFSGGAAISREVAEFIDNIGVTVFEGYGLTETSPIATANCPKARRMGSVGKPIPGTRVTIDHDATGDPVNGELVIYGHNVMQGYYNLPEEDAKVFTKDNGFRTGDMGKIDPDGFVFITGRIKEQYKLENGKYVVPVPIEEAIKLSSMVTNVMVCGANKPFNVAVVVPEIEGLKKWAAEHGVATEPVTEMLCHPEVKRRISEEIARVSHELKGYEKVRDFILSLEDFSVENDMMTPKMSLKRRNITARYEIALAALYNNTAEPSS